MIFCSTVIAVPEERLIKPENNLQHHTNTATTECSYTASVGEYF